MYDADSARPVYRLPGCNLSAASHNNEYSHCQHTCGMYSHAHENECRANQQIPVRLCRLFSFPRLHAFGAPPEPPECPSYGTAQRLLCKCVRRGHVERRVTTTRHERPG